MKRKFRKPIPSQEYLRTILAYDPETGIFTRVSDRRQGRWKCGSTMGTKSPDGYINLSIDYVIYRAHRIAWVYMTGKQPPDVMDHINGHRTDNRWCNLREATQTQNLYNKSTWKSRDLPKGVWKRKDRKLRPWRAEIISDGTKYRLGTFKTAEEAKAAYDSAAKVLHGEFFKS